MMSTGIQMAPQVAVARHPTNRLLELLEPDDLGLLAPWLRDIRLEPGTLLHEADETIQHVYFPHGGMISLTVVMRSGEAIEATMVGREGAAGILAGLGLRRAQERAVVQIAGTAARISVPNFQAAIARSPTIQAAVVDYAGLLMACYQQSTACNALHDLESRLCRWLLQADDRAGNGRLALTQEFLAQMLGVRRTSVTMIARMLQASGMIHYRRGVIEIADRHALEQASCECYGTLRRKFDGSFSRGA
jgi:CRP-like cAMP-binding protein